MTAPRIAFLGLGIMGTGMTRRLLGAGFPVIAWNRDRAKADALASAGAKVAATPRDAAAGAEFVFSMVADDAASRRVWLGDDGALAAAAPDAILVECSTLTVAWVNELAAAARGRGLELVDAPVTGSKVAANNGELNFLVGASAAAFARVQPVLAPMSRSVTHLGPPGSGALIKLINNFLCGVQVASIGEAMAWIERGGLDRAKALPVILDGAPGSPLIKLLATRMTAGDFAPNFKLGLMAKDLEYAVKTAAAHGLALPTATGALEEFRRALAAGQGERDMAAIVEPLRAKR